MFLKKAIHYGRVRAGRIKRGLLNECGAYYTFRRMDRCRSHEVKDKIRVVFILQFPEMWSSFASVYEEMKKDDGIEPFVITIPKIKDISQRIFEEKNEALDFCERIAVPADNGLVNGRVLPIKELHPDYIMIQRAYDEYMPKEYALKELQKIAPICYISYSGRTTKGKHISIEFDPLLQFFHLLFADCTEVADYVNAKRRFRIFSKYQKVYDIGFPRFDLITPGESTNRIKTFLWAPRWTVHEKDGSSHFLDYCDLLMDYFSEHKELELIIRPHPLLFATCIQNGIKTEEEISELRHRIKESSNISLDEADDYREAVDRAHAIISDSSSLLLMYFFTGKPVILTLRSMEKHEYTSVYRRIVSTYYVALREQELFERIEKLIKGEDEKQLKRRALLQELWPDGQPVCERIVEAIHKDYEEYHK